jgi:hypothetical protein
MAQASSNPFTVRIKAAVNSALPAWIPPEGHFANISLNTMYDVRPAGWPTSDAAGPFALWSGGIYAHDFSDLGAYVVHGSGHLAPGAALWAGVWCFDLDTLQWVGRNIPPVPLLQGDTNNSPTAEWNEYAESILPENLGHVRVPHTYDGLVYQPAAYGGGANGSMIRCFFAGSKNKNAVHRFDLSSTSAPGKRVISAVPFGSTGTSLSGAYPTSALDTARGGFWLLTANGNGPLKFVKFSDWSVSSYSGVGYNDYGDHSLIYLPPPYDCLVGMGRNGSGGLLFKAWLSRIVNNVPQPFVPITMTGAIPTNDIPSGLKCGGQWSSLLNCIVSYQANGSYNVHKLTPPAPANLATGSWNWTTETLTGVASATPSKCPNTSNGAWSRFIEVPAARCFIWCDSVQQPVQAWRLTGM